MSLIDRNTLSFRNAGGAPGDVDALLRSFFRAEMPNPWPVLKAPVEKREVKPESAAPGRWSRSRMALAASVGFLMVGSWCLSAKLPDCAPGSPEGGNGVGNMSRTIERPVLPNPPKGKIGETSKKKCCEGCCSEK
jgi:hypothetical protein